MYLKNLEAEKARKRVTDDDLAALIGLKFRENFSKKKAACKFTLDEAKKLASFFGVSIDYLFEESD